VRKLFIRREGLREYITRYPVISAILTVNILAMVYTSFRGGINHPFVVYLTGGIIPEAIDMGQYWRLITYAFLHNGIYHFGFNLFFLYLFSPPLERMLGKVRFSLLFLVTVLGSGILVYCLNHTAVGSSGFGYGLLGFYLYLILFHPHVLDAQSRQIVIIFTVIGWVSTLIIPNVSFSGHLGGYVAGFVFGLLLKRKYQQWYR
jgi:rhomboid protease GluP